MPLSDYIELPNGEWVNTSLASPPQRGGTGWANAMRQWLRPNAMEKYGDILPVASSTQYNNPTTLDSQGRAIHGAEQAYTSRRPAMPNMVRETLGNLVNYADAPRAAAMGEMDPTTPENAEMLARGAFDAGAGGMLLNKMPRGAIGAFGRTAKDLTPSEQQAQSVIDLLKSGKASSVTDDMLAAADQKYLYDNYDLPMDVESRMARAKDMGFGDTPYYHGTGANIDAFDPRYSRMDSAGTGVYTTSDPYTASSYAELEGVRTPQVYPLKVKGDVDSVYADFEGRNWDDFGADLDSSRFGSTKDSSYDPFGWADRDPEDLVFERYRTDDMARSAKIDNHESALFENVTDHVSEYDLGESNVRVDFNPSNIRSQFARFDPRLSHLSNLSASGMSPTAAVGAKVNPWADKSGEVSAESSMDILRRIGELERGLRENPDNAEMIKRLIGYLEQ